LPASLEDRQNIYEEGLSEVERLGFVSNDAKAELVVKLDTFYLLNGSGDNRTFTDSATAIEFLRANPGWRASDGTHRVTTKTSFWGTKTVSHEILIYATATSPGTFLRNVGDLAAYRAAGNSFIRTMTSVENVIQTISHEAGHHVGLDHNNSMWNREFDVIRQYREVTP